MGYSRKPQPIMVSADEAWSSGGLSVIAYNYFSSDAWFTVANFGGAPVREMVFNNDMDKAMYFSLNNGTGYHLYVRSGESRILNFREKGLYFNGGVVAGRYVQALSSGNLFFEYTY